MGSYIHFFNMKHSVKFYLEKRKSSKSKDTPILMYVSFKGDRLQYYTGCRCLANQWIDSTTTDGVRIQQMKRNSIAPNGDTFVDVNNRLNTLKAETAKILNHAEALSIEKPKEYLKTELDKILNKKRKIDTSQESNNFFDRYEKYVENSTFSTGRKKHYATSIKKLKSFKPDLTFETLTPQTLYDFQKYLFVHYNNSKNTVSGEMKRLRAFLKYAMRNHYTKNYPFENYKIPAETYGEPFFLTLEERDILYNAKITPPHIERAKDIFVFQCLIGCRVGDLVKFTKSSIIDGCIEYIAGKTRDNKPRIARVPLTKKPLAIIEKYNLPGEKLLPYISSVKYNEYIKKALFKAGITRAVTIIDKETQTSIQVPICEIASSQMARRTFIGGLYRKNAKNEIIASMSGHSEKSTSFRRYHNIDRENQKDTIKLIE